MSAADKQEQQFDETPEGWAARWKFELDASKAWLADYQKQGDAIVKRFLDERDAKTKGKTRWNLFTANVQTIGAMLYGKAPKVDVTRRFADSDDDVARVAAETFERLLNTDIEKDGDTYALALQQALSDRLLPGVGFARIRYTAEFEKVEATPAKSGADGKELAPAVPETEKVSTEDVAAEYVPWRDVLWSSGARVWQEVRWLAFRSQMSREALIERFGKEIGNVVPLNAKRGEDAEGDSQKSDPWQRAEVWEIWDKESEQAFWWVDGFGKVLDLKKDPYELEAFFPCPRPMVANLTTSAFVPRADYTLAQDLYLEVDELSTRIALLIDAVNVRGVYDKTAGPVTRLLQEGAGNDLIPVENWALFAEKGGLKGVVDWFPLEMVVMAIDKLREYRTETVSALYQLTGMSDIMRGQASTVGATATEQSIKAKFSSVRVQALQDEFARFASDLQRLKAELIAKRFSPETIIQRANSQYTYDAQHPELLAQAVALMKSKYSCYRIEVKPEAVSMTDFAALKQDRLEVMAGVSQFIAAAQPLMAAMPGSLPFLLKVLQWNVAGLRGASTIEAVFDEGIAAAESMGQQPQAQAAPDSKLQVQAMKQQGEMQKLQAETQAHAQRAQIDVAAETQKQEIQTQQNVKEEIARARIKQAHSPPPAFGPGGVGG